MEEALDVIRTKVESTEDIPLLVREIQPVESRWYTNTVVRGGLQTPFVPEAR